MNVICCSRDLFCALKVYNSSWLRLMSKNEQDSVNLFIYTLFTLQFHICLLAVTIMVVSCSDICKILKCMSQ